jgi:hypothetical protein
VGGKEKKTAPQEEKRMIKAAPGKINFLKKRKK